MADNVTAPTTDEGGPVFATDDDGAAHHPYVKLEFGADNTQTKVSSANPLPVDATAAGDVPVTLAGEAVVLGAGTAAFGKLAANSGVDIGDVDVTSHPTDTFAADGAAYGKGVLMQGDDGTDRRAVLVDEDGHLQADLLTQPAADRTTDNVGAALATDAIMDDTTVLTPKFAVIDDASSGDNTIVAAVSGKKIRVLSYVLVAAGTVTARFESGAAGTALTGQMSLVDAVGVSAGFSPVGHFETAVDALLNLELSGAVSVDGHLTYVEV
jgi:hypothetical protein